MKSIRLRTCIVIFAIATFALSLAIAKDSDDEQRLQKAAQVLGEVINIPDNIPQDLIDKSECVIVLPSVAFCVSSKLGIGERTRGIYVGSSFRSDSKIPLRALSLLRPSNKKIGRASCRERV